MSGLHPAYSDFKIQPTYSEVFKTEELYSLELMKFESSERSDSDVSPELKN